MQDKWFYAVHVNDVTILTECIIKGFDIDMRDENGNYAIHYATKSSNKNLLLFLIKNGADVNSRDLYGNTPIIIACSKGDVIISDILIKNGCDVNLRNKKYNTALHYAIHESTGTTILLLQNGADINLLDSGGETPLLTALKNGYSAIVSIFLQKYTEYVLKLMFYENYTIIKKSLFIFNIENNIKMNKNTTICISDSIFDEYKNRIIIYSIGFERN